MPAAEQKSLSGLCSMDPSILTLLAGPNRMAIEGVPKGYLS